MNRLGKAAWLKASILFVLVLLLAACGGGDAKETTTSETSSEKTAEAGDNEKTYTLKMNVAFPPPVLDWEPKQKSTEDFAKLVEEKTDGRVKIEIYFNNQLAGEKESLDALAKGTIDLQSTTPHTWADRVPESNFPTLAYWNMGPDHTKYMLTETELGELYEEALDEYGVKVLFYWGSDATGYMSNKPIAKPEDLKGLILNQSGSLTANYYKAMGAATANVPVAELFEALHRGTLDAVIAHYNALESYNFHEVVKYVTVPGSVDVIFGLVAIGEDKWNEIPKDLQDAIMEASEETEVESFEAAKKLTDHAMAFAKENDIEVIEMSDEAIQEAQELSKEYIWDEFAKMNDRTKRMVEVINEENEKWIKENK